MPGRRLARSLSEALRHIGEDDDHPTILLSAGWRCVTCDQVVLAAADVWTWSVVSEFVGLIRLVACELIGLLNLVARHLQVSRSIWLCSALLRGGYGSAGTG